MKRGFPLAIQKLADRVTARLRFSCAFALVALISTAPLYAEEPPTLLIMGDSLSAAYGIEQDQSWVTLLAERLEDDAQVVNASISGETTSGGAQRFADIIGQQQPDIVLLELGGNDGLRGLPPAQMRANLATMIEQSQQADAEVLLLGIDSSTKLRPSLPRCFHWGLSLPSGGVRSLVSAFPAGRHRA